MKTTIFPLIMLIALSISLSAQNVGDIAPDFSLIDTKGNTVTLSQYKDDKAVGLFFFGNGCPPCIAIAPDVESQIQQIYGNTDDFVLLGLDQWDGNKAMVESFQIQTGTTFTLLQNASATAVKYNTTWDRIILVDINGKIAYKGSKPVSTDLVAIISAIDGLSGTTPATEIGNKLSIEVYPNPVVSLLQFKLNTIDNEKIEVSLKSIDGKTVRTLKNAQPSDSQNAFSLNLEGVAPGIYFANVKVGNKEQTFKIVKLN